MTREDQTRIVDELCNGMRDRIASEIAAGVIPEHWNGIQLRLLVEERARDNADVGSIDRGDRRRFASDCLERGL